MNQVIFLTRLTKLATFLCSNLETHLIVWYWSVRCCVLGKKQAAKGCKIPHVESMTPQRNKTDYFNWKIFLGFVFSYQRSAQLLSYLATKSLASFSFNQCRKWFEQSYHSGSVVLIVDKRLKEKLHSAGEDIMFKVTEKHHNQRL